MSANCQIVFKVASDAGEYDQIHRLNYRTFVKEIPQHAPNPSGQLVDRFHAQNTYLIALSGGLLVGMMAVRDQRPFSLDEKLENLDSHLPSGQKLCELRLLAVIPSHRNGRVFQGLLALLLDCARSRRYDLALISGSVRQFKLYRHLGFSPFGPLVGPRKAQYQPMYLPLFGGCLGQLNLQHLRPQGAVVRVHPLCWSARLLADPGQEYVLFLSPERNGLARNGSHHRVADAAIQPITTLEMDLPSGQYSIRWLDPITSRGLVTEQRDHGGGLVALTPPSSIGPMAGCLRRIGESKMATVTS
jgi:hypothetical protein